VLAHLGAWGAFVVFDTDQAGCVLRLLERLGHDERYVLAGVTDAVVLKGSHGLECKSPTRHRPRGRQLRRVQVGDDVEHARRRLGTGGVQACDAPAGDSTLDEDRVDQSLKHVVGAVAGGARHLLPPVDAIDRGADSSGGAGARRT
jgi:hypothetical protein